MIISSGEKIHVNMRRMYEKQADRHVTILDLSESGYIVNVLPSSLDLDELRYELVDRDHTALVDGKDFELDINEFGSNR